MNNIQDVNIVKIDNSTQKSQICEKILRALPAWFGIESAILNYINEVKNLNTWTAMSENKAVGLISIKIHNHSSAEIYVMGILPEFHGKKIGKKLLQTTEAYLKSKGYKYLTVKTLSPAHPDKNYAITRNFYQKMGFTPLEEFKTIWGESNPCLMLIKNIIGEHYAVIFTSQRKKDDPQGYKLASDRMIQLAEKQNGFISFKSLRDETGLGITVSYWKSKDDIKKWKNHIEHLKSQDLGRNVWYEFFSTQICIVEEEYQFTKNQL